MRSPSVGRPGLGCWPFPDLSCRPRAAEPDRWVVVRPVQVMSLESPVMRVVRRDRRLTGWIAALAILLASLAPALSHALASATGSGWVEVCTAQGSKWVQAGPDGGEHAPASAHLLEHCPYCSLHTPSLGLPPAAPPVPGLLPRVHEAPRAWLPAPRTLHPWVRAQPRAPPLFS